MLTNARNMLMKTSVRHLLVTGDYPTYGAPTSLLQSRDHIPFREIAIVDVGVGGAIGGKVRGANGLDSGASRSAKGFPGLHLARNHLHLLALHRGLPSTAAIHVHRTSTG